MNHPVRIIECRRRKQPAPLLEDGVINVYITASQKKAFCFIAEQIDKSMPPSYKEIMAYMEYASWNAVQHILKRLKETGLVETSRHPNGTGVHRSLRLTEFGRSVWQMLKENM